MDLWQQTPHACSLVACVEIFLGCIAIYPLRRLNNSLLNCLPSSILAREILKCKCVHVHVLPQGLLLQSISPFQSSGLSYLPRLSSPNGLCKGSLEHTSLHFSSISPSHLQIPLPGPNPTVIIFQRKCRFPTIVTILYL